MCIYIFFLSTCTWTPCAHNCPGVHRPVQWKLRLGEYLSKWTWCTALHLATATVRNAKKYEKKDTDLAGAPVKKEKKEKREKETHEKKDKSKKRKTGEGEAETKTPTRKSKKSKTKWFLGWYICWSFLILGMDCRQTAIAICWNTNDDIYVSHVGTCSTLWWNSTG